MKSPQCESPLPMDYCDIHSHHFSEEFNVMRITALVAPSSDIPEACPFSAGIHPKDIAQYSVSDYVTLWNNPQCCAIGECGLDRRYVADIPLSVQTEIFLQQAHYAEDLKKPLVIHCVRCYDEMFRLKQKEKPSVPWVLHSFRGNERKTMMALDCGFYLSFGPGLLRDEGNVAPFFDKIPQDRVFFETDDDENADIAAIYAVAASLWGVSVLDLVKNVDGNVREVFNLCVQ